MVYRVDSAEAELLSSKCSIGAKAEVYAEAHAIQEGLEAIGRKSLPPTTITICADNHSALTILSSGNPTNTEYARLALTAIAYKKQAGK